MRTLDEMLDAAKDQQNRLSRFDGSHDPVLWRELVKEMLSDLSHAKGPKADEFITAVARGVIFLERSKYGEDTEIKQAITQLWTEALTGDFVYQSRLGSIVWALTGFISLSDRADLFKKLPKLEEKTCYGDGLVRAYHALKYGG